MPQKSTRKKTSFKRIWVIVLAFLTILFLGIFGWFRFGDYQIKKEFSNLNIPASWQLIDERVSGGELCWDLCRGWSRKYSLALGEELTATDIRNIIVSGGFVINGESSTVCDDPRRKTDLLHSCYFVGNKTSREIRIVYESSLFKENKNNTREGSTTGSIAIRIEKDR